METELARGRAHVARRLAEHRRGRSTRPHEGGPTEAVRHKDGNRVVDRTLRMHGAGGYGDGTPIKRMFTIGRGTAQVLCSRTPPACSGGGCRNAARLARSRPPRRMPCPWMSPLRAPTSSPPGSTPPAVGEPSDCPAARSRRSSAPSSGPGSPSSCAITRTRQGSWATERLTWTVPLDPRGDSGTGGDERGQRRRERRSGSAPIIFRAG